ncbi:hypothetical protein PENTCL1PPCAC_11167 [Pristionchus entomophagus]|uniref:Short coiled-coil protein n=1 Tax=Pristionchus entomophagus TaxID=358040 RepID=A0AAV5T082_9BILA|nr:hypothetical protein PENTCL1PPCAC_11167 [Pristionchus entomophagus]
MKARTLSKWWDGLLDPRNLYRERNHLRDAEEKARLIAHVLELQDTLDDLSQRVECVKEESVKLRSENQVLGQYIQNLMASSSVFQSSTPAPKGDLYDW